MEPAPPFVVLDGVIGPVQLSDLHRNVFLAVTPHALAPPAGTPAELTRARTDISVGASRAPRFRDPAFSLVASAGALSLAAALLRVEAFEARGGQGVACPIERRLLLLQWCINPFFYYLFIYLFISLQFLF
jgi:hypothetical protein